MIHPTPMLFLPNQINFKRHEIQLKRDVNITSDSEGPPSTDSQNEPEMCQIKTDDA